MKGTSIYYFNKQAQIWACYLKNYIVYIHELHGFMTALLESIISVATESTIKNLDEYNVSLILVICIATYW